MWIKKHNTPAAAGCKLVNFRRMSLRMKCIFQRLQRREMEKNSGSWRHRVYSPSSLPLLSNFMLWSNKYHCRICQLTSVFLFLPADVTIQAKTLHKWSHTFPGVLPSFKDSLAWNATFSWQSISPISSSGLPMGRQLSFLQFTLIELRPVRIKQQQQQIF